MIKILKEVRIYILLLIIAVLGATTLFALDRLIMPMYTNHNTGITVPDVTHLSLDEAQDLLTSKGFRFEVIAQRAHEAFPPNYVTDQSPNAEIIVKPNRKVYLTINTTTRSLVTVPDVTNLSLRNAEIQLQNYGLRLGQVTYESSRFTNSVLRQSLRAESSVERGAVVDLVVSDGLGSRKVNVPDIIGLRVAQGQQQLRAEGLRIGSTRFEVSRDVEPNIILDYSPKETEVFEGTTIDLVISEAPDRIEETETGVVDIDSSDEDPDEENDDSEDN